MGPCKKIRKLFEHSSWWIPQSLTRSENLYYWSVTSDRDRSTHLNYLLYRQLYVSIIPLHIIYTLRIDTSYDTFTYRVTLLYATRVGLLHWRPDSHVLLVHRTHLLNLTPGDPSPCRTRFRGPSFSSPVGSLMFFLLH